MEPKALTREEFLEKYGEVKVKFSSYYKYTFTYEGITPDGKRITCGYGGNDEAIYRHDVDASREITINVVYPFMGSVYENGVEIETFYDY